MRKPTQVFTSALARLSWVAPSSHNTRWPAVLTLPQGAPAPIGPDIAAKTPETTQSLLAMLGLQLIAGLEKRSARETVPGLFQILG